MQKKKFWLWLLSVFMLALSIFSLTACGKMDDTLYFGTYKDQSTTFEIKKDCVEINGEKRTYTIDGNTLSIEGYTGDMHFYEHGKVLSFDVIVEFDSGRITERNKNFSTTLWEYSNGGISLAYTFNLDGTVSYFNADRPVENASGTYRIKDGVIKISTVNLIGKQNTMYLYVSEEGELHFTGVYVKDLDTYFDNGSGNNSSSGNNSTNDNSSSDNDSGSNENENNPPETPPLTFYEVTFDYGYEQKEVAVNIQEGGSVQLNMPEREGYTFNGWSINGETKNSGDIITVTQNITAYAQWTENRYTITYNLNGGQMPHDGVMYEYAIYNLPYTLPIPQGTDTQSFVKWTTDEAGKNEIKTITELGNYTLYAHYENSANFLSYKYNETLQGYVVADFTGNGTFVKIPSTYKGVAVKSIDYEAFRCCTSLTSVEIPDSVTLIGGCAFYGSSSLTEIVIPDSVTSIGSHAFYNCTSLTSVNIPDGVTLISNSTFSGCSSLTNVDIPDSVTSIDYAAFADCTSLTSVEIPDSVTSIYYEAFADCTSLTSVEIPDSVTSIYYEAFADCTSLTSVEIPDSVREIGSSAFYNCLALKTIIIDSSDVANVSFIGDIITYATDVYIRADITITVGIYNVLYNNLGKETINGVEYYHYQIKGE